MKSVSGKDFCKALERKGWKLNKINGSHHIYTKDKVPLRISVPVHGNKTLKIGLLKHLMKQTGIEENEI